MRRIENGRLAIAFDEDGRVCAIYVEGRNCLARPCRGFALSIDDALVDGADFTFDGFSQSDGLLSLGYTSPSCHVEMSYRKVGLSIAASAHVTFPSHSQGMLRWFEFIWPSLCFDSPEMDVFHAPGQGACHELTSLNINFTPGCRVSALGAFETREDMFSTTPDKGAGLLCIEAQDGACVGLAPYGEEENFFPMVHLEHDGLTVIHRNMIVADLSRFQEIGTGELFILGSRYRAVLSAYQDLISNHLCLAAPGCPQWFRQTSLVEVHSSHLGGFRAGIGKLGYLKSIGIDVVYLMPCYSYRNNMKDHRYVHGFRETGYIYSVLDNYEVDSIAGGEEGLREFIEAAHSEGMHVLLDFIPQGSHPEGVLFREHPEWFCRDENGDFFPSHGWRATLSLDWANPEVARYFIDMGLHYVKNFDIDGFRIDAPHWKEPNFAKDLPYRASHTCFGSIRMLRRLFDEARAIRPDIVFMGEVWGVAYESFTTCQCEYNIHWALWNTATGVFCGRDLQKWLDEYRYTQLPGSEKVVFLETHDTQLLTPVAQRYRGSLVSDMIAYVYAFCGFIPMVWYEEIERNAGLVKRISELRGRLGYPYWMDVDYENISSGSDDVFVASQCDGRRIVLADFARNMVHAALSFAQLPSWVEPDGRYRLVGIMDGKVFQLHRRVDDGIETYEEFKGSQLDGLVLDIFPFQPYLLEIERIGEDK